MLNEQAPTLQIKDVDLTQYADKLIARFANPALKHKTWQIAMDGSQKLPQRMLAGIRIHLGCETDWSLLALGVAGWMRYVSALMMPEMPLMFAIRLAIKFANLLRAAAVNNA